MASDPFNSDLALYGRPYVPSQQYDVLAGRSGQEASNDLNLDLCFIAQHPELDWDYHTVAQRPDLSWSLVLNKYLVTREADLPAEDMWFRPDLWTGLSRRADLAEMVARYPNLPWDWAEINKS